MEAALSEAVWALEGGYCLWVGAGLTRCLAAGHADVPLWSQVTLELESAAGLQTEDNSDFPTRLDKCMAVLGEGVFHRFLRERYYSQLCCALLSQAVALLDAEDFVPDSAQALAALGQMANPIVSFNVEPLSSLLLARPAGPVRIMFQQPRGKPSHIWRELTSHFHRVVYHPHGLATVDTVMTASQYESNAETLAFGLAIHSAFGNTLVIVGMSLDDRYLRRQIERFRANIGAIYWFNSQFSDELSSWAKEHSITTVCSEWSAFWQHWRTLPIDFQTQDLIAAWYLAVSEAVDEAEGGSLGSLQRSLNGQQPTDVGEDLRRLAAALSEAGSFAGEPAKTRLISGMEPRTIELALRTRLINAHFPLPIIAKTYDPHPH